MEHVKLREKIGYGLGDAASSMFWKLFTMYLLFFYTDVVGISAAVVGTMFLITRIWDTFLDPFIGILGDRTHSRFGKFHHGLFVAKSFTSSFKDVFSSLMLYPFFCPRKSKEKHNSRQYGKNDGSHLPTECL